MPVGNEGAGVVIIRVLRIAVIDHPVEQVKLVALRQRSHEMFDVIRARAAQAGNFNEVVKYMPKYQAQKSLESLSKVKDKNERLMRKKVLQEMAVKGFTVTRCAVSPDGKIAALAGKGKRINGGKYQETNGTVKFLNENGNWKVAFQIWS